jgi:P-type Cu+ transporter
MTATTADPVCGMGIDRFEAYSSGRFEGHTYYFCSDVCKMRFDADPERYVFGDGTADLHP